MMNCKMKKKMRKEHKILYGVGIGAMIIMVVIIVISR